MKRLDYQEDTVERFSNYLETLVAKGDAAEKFAELARQNQMEPPVVDWCGQTWDSLKASGVLPSATDASGTKFVPPWLHRVDGIGRPVPNLCLKLPTGAGKTYIATRAIEQLQRIYYRRSHGLVLWVVPSDAIYKQTWKALANREHPYRMTLERASGGRVKLLRKGDTFSKSDVENYLCVFVMMMAAAARELTDPLKMFQDSGRYPGFFPPEDDFEAQKELLKLVPNLGTLDLAEGAWGGGPTVKQSLGNVLCLARPTVILDEGHKAFSPIRRATLAKFNPSFILELSATPNRAKEQQSNVLHSVTGMALKKEEMVKLPLNLHNAGKGDWKDTLIAAHGKLSELQAMADCEQDETHRYVRPILLIRVERTGKDQTEAGKVHANDVRKFLHEHLGAKEGEVAEKSSAEDELSVHDLLSDTCPVRFIITKAALQEGWDCPFAYVLAVLDETTAGTALTQMIGRILRQPYAEYFSESRAALNQSHVYVHRQNVADAVAKVREGLSSEGMGDLGELVRAAGTTSTGGNVVMVELERRAAFRRRIFLPRILTREGNDWRLFDYESDLFPHVDWETLVWSKSAEFSPDDASSLAHTLVAVDVDQLGHDTKKPLGVTETGEKPDLDFPALTRLLADVIPNPWQAARILRGALASLRARDFSEDQLLASRYRLIEKMRADLLADIHVQTERIFCDLLADGGLSFRLEGKGLSWELLDKLAFEVTQPPDFPIAHKSNGQPVEKSLFEQIWSKHFNNLEKDVALYIDDVKAVRWWHRIAVQADWYLDGWKKKKVFPDFLVSLEETKGKPSKLVVVETKGLHLKNEDTDYKRKLFETLEQYSDGGVPVGELVLGDAPGPMLFRLVFDQDWKSQVDAALLAAEA
ncbi:MAG: DEAD/DEAH box helicase [Akkermansiaceae bacterium]|jgi:type III restriction enzyme